MYDLNALKELNLTSFFHRKPLMAALLLAGFVYGLWQVAQVSRESAMTHLLQKTQADINRYSLSLQQKLGRYKDMPRLLSTHSELINPLLYDWSSDAHMRANLYLEQVNRIIGASDTYLMNPAGETVAASNWGRAHTFVGQNFAFRPYFQQAMHGELGRYFALGTRSGKRGYFFAYPVQHRGAIIGVVVVKIDLNAIEQDWSDPLTDLLVTDADGVIFISTRPQWKFYTVKPLDNELKASIGASQRYGEHPLQPLAIHQQEQESDYELVSLNTPEGKKEGRFLLQNQSVADTGLRVVMLASLKPVSRQVINATLLAAAIAFTLLFLVLVLLARRRIIRERARFKAREVAALAASETRIKAIIDHTRAGLVTLDANGAVTSFNHTAEKFFGYREAQLSGQHFCVLLSEPDQLVCRQYLARNNRNTFELSTEVEGKHADGNTFPISLTIGVMPEDEGQLRFIATIQDITERKAYERALKQIQEELENRVKTRTQDLTLANIKLTDEMAQHRATQNELIQAAKLAVLGQMSAGINHELNQPLTAIRAYADNARQFLALSRYDSVQDNLQEISCLTERMAKIIHPLKEFARKASDQPEPVSLRAVQEGAMSILYGRLQKESVTIQWPDNLETYSVQGDLVSIEQVLVNLIGNAIQAMEADSSKRVEVSLERQGPQLALHIRDFGPGIPAADLGRVFEPFYTTKAAGQGLGLGLSISHRIATNLGGQLSAANHPEGGAVFTLLLTQFHPES